MNYIVRMTHITGKFLEISFLFSYILYEAKFSDFPLNLLALSVATLKNKATVLEAAQTLPKFTFILLLMDRKTRYYLLLASFLVFRPAEIIFYEEYQAVLE